MSVVVVTHELDSAFKIADRIVVLDRGYIIFSGTVDEIKASDNQRIQNLINRILKKKILTLSFTPSSLSAVPFK